MVKTPTLIGRGIYRYSQSSTNQRPQCKAPSNPALPTPESAVGAPVLYRIPGSPAEYPSTWPLHTPLEVQEAAQQHWRTPPFALLGDSLSFPVTGSDPSWSFGSQTHKKNSHRMAAIGIGMDRIYLSFLARRNVVAMGCGKW